MSIWKIVSGIISIVLCFFVIFQSCAAGLINTLTQNGDVSGSAGLLVAVLLLVGGIVSIATRDAVGNGGNIAVIIIYGITAAIGYLMAGIYTDLVIWATWCLICAVMAAMAIAADNVCSAWVYIVIAIIGIVIAVGGFGMNLNSDDQEPAPKKEQVLDVIPKDDSSEDEQEGENNQPESDNGEAAAGAVDLGNYVVEIKGAALAEDNEGNPAIIINYAWTNNSEGTTSAMIALIENAFQGGIELDRAYIRNSDTYNSDNRSKDIRPGATFDVQCAFVLRDETSPVEVEISETFSFSDATATMDFDLENLS